MKCQSFTLGGATVFICGGRPSRSSLTGTCRFCMKNKASKLCDQVIHRDGKKRTCDAEMCESCATNSGRDVDYCPDHKNNHPAQGLLNL